MIKITDELAARLGITSAEDVEAGFAERNRLRGTQASDTAKFTDLEKRIAALEAKPAASLSATDTDALVAKAVAQADANANVIAGKAVSAAIARAGQSGLAPNKPEGEPSEAKANLNNLDPEARWEKDANLRAEFGDRKASWLAYQKANATGRVSLLTNTTRN